MKFVISVRLNKRRPIPLNFERLHKAPIYISKSLFVNSQYKLSFVKIYMWEIVGSVSFFPFDWYKNISKKSLSNQFRHHPAGFQVDVKFGIIQSAVPEKLPDHFQHAGGDKLVDEKTVPFQ